MYTTRAHVQTHNSHDLYMPLAKMPITLPVAVATAIAMEVITFRKYTCIANYYSYCIAIRQATSLTHTSRGIVSVRSSLHQHYTSIRSNRSHEYPYLLLSEQTSSFCHLESLPCLKSTRLHAETRTASSLCMGLP
jgi:hypothetical protein